MFTDVSQGLWKKRMGGVYVLGIGIGFFSPPVPGLRPGLFSCRPSGARFGGHIGAVVSHPFHDEAVKWMGHPGFAGQPGKAEPEVRGFPTRGCRLMPHRRAWDFCL
jgi:hypothetical protein